MIYLARKYGSLVLMTKAIIVKLSEKGVLKDYLYDYLTAKKKTGPQREMDGGIYQHRPLPGMTIPSRP